MVWTTSKVLFRRNGFVWSSTKGLTMTYCSSSSSIFDRSSVNPLKATRLSQRINHYSGRLLNRSPVLSCGYLHSLGLNLTDFDRRSPTNIYQIDRRSDVGEASVRLGHKSLRTLMKRSSSWYLPGDLSPTKNLSSPLHQSQFSRATQKKVRRLMTNR